MVIREGKNNFLVREGETRGKKENKIAFESATEGGKEKGGRATLLVKVIIV